MRALEYQEKWATEFGNDYQSRNNIPGDARQVIWNKLQAKLDIDFSNVLEVGCARGHNLRCLGLFNRIGLEINEKAIKERLVQNIVKGSAYDIPFIENQFDLVFTAGVLIHLSDTKKAMQEIKRVSKKYILSIEYFSDKDTEIHYRHDVYCAARNWPKLWEDLGCKVLMHGEMKEFGGPASNDDFARSCHYILVEK